MKPAAVEVVIGSPALLINRYHLQAPAFSGEDVQQFITKFSDVAAIFRWPVKVTLIQLWLCLTGAAKPYDIDQDVGDIFAALRAIFGLTARDVCVQLQGLRKDPKTSFARAPDRGRTAGTSCLW